jgi:hypothetical protein
MTGKILDLIRLALIVALGFFFAGMLYLSMKCGFLRENR